MEHTDKEVADILLEELSTLLENTGAEYCAKEVIEVNQKDQTVTIKFDYNVIPEDDYTGFLSY